MPGEAIDACDRADMRMSSAARLPRIFLRERRLTSKISCRHWPTPPISAATKAEMLAG